MGNLVFYGGCVAGVGGRMPPHLDVCSCMLAVGLASEHRQACLLRRVCGWSRGQNLDVCSCMPAVGLASEHRQACLLRRVCGWGRGQNLDVCSCMLVVGLASEHRQPCPLRRVCVGGVGGRMPPHLDVCSCRLVVGQWISATLCLKEGFSPSRHQVFYEEVLGKLLQGFQDSRFAQ